MFNVVREKYGACYSPSSSVIGSKAPVGTEILVNVSDKKNFASYMKEARTLMAQGKVIEDVSPDGTYVFASGAEKLDSYKNSYITSTYASSASSGGMAERMVYNLFQFNDIDYNVFFFDPTSCCNLLDNRINIIHRYICQGLSFRQGCR